MIPRIFIISAAAVLCGTLFAQEAVSNQEYLARVDRLRGFEDGVYNGRLTIAKRGAADGAGRTVFDVTLYQRGDARLFEFASARRGLEAQLFCLDDGRTIWYRDHVRRRLRRIEDAARLEPVLGSGFAYVDLSGLAFETQYTGVRLQEFQPADGGGTGGVPAGAQYRRLELRPISANDATSPASPYGRAVLIFDVADPEQYRPIRLDLFDDERILYKTLLYHYDRRLIRRSTGTAFVPERPAGLEMLDLNGRTVSRFELDRYDDVRGMADALFDPRRPYAH